MLWLNSRSSKQASEQPKIDGKFHIQAKCMCKQLCAQTKFECKARGHYFGVEKKKPTKNPTKTQFLNACVRVYLWVLSSKDKSNWNKFCEISCIDKKRKVKIKNNNNNQRISLSLCSAKHNKNLIEKRVKIFVVNCEFEQKKKNKWILHTANCWGEKNTIISNGPMYKCIDHQTAF